MTEGKTKTFGGILIVIVGLLNFHIPHFLLEPNDLSGASRTLELIFAVNVLGAFTDLGVRFSWQWLRCKFGASGREYYWLS